MELHRALLDEAVARDPRRARLPAGQNDRVAGAGLGVGVVEGTGAEDAPLAHETAEPAGQVRVDPLGPQLIHRQDEHEARRLDRLLGNQQSATAEQGQQAQQQQGRSPAQTATAGATGEHVGQSLSRQSGQWP